MKAEMLQGTVSVREILTYIESDRYLCLAEAVEYLSLSERTMRELLPEIKHYRVGRKLLFRKSDLDRWVQKYQESSADLDLERLADEALRDVLGDRK